jgi:transposase
LPVQITGLRNKRKSVIALRNNKHKLREPVTFAGTANSLLIYQYIQLIRSRIKGKIAIILDNASCHKTKALQDYCTRNGITLIYLPPYSPDLNPIEKLWGTIKKIMKRLSQNGRTLIENLRDALSMYSFEIC